MIPWSHILLLPTVGLPNETCGELQVSRASTPYSTGPLDPHPLSLACGIAFFSVEACLPWPPPVSFLSSFSLYQKLQGIPGSASADVPMDGDDPREVLGDTGQSGTRI